VLVGSLAAHLQKIGVLVFRDCNEQTHSQGESMDTNKQTTANNKPMDSTKYGANSGAIPAKKWDKQDHPDSTDKQSSSRSPRDVDDTRHPEEQIPGTKEHMKDGNKSLQEKSSRI
jgi:hypothetical protein